MAFMIMDPSNQTFKQLMGNGIQYFVPKFQRDYSWDKEQWEDLWEDIDNLQESEHYMGYIVLQNHIDDKNVFDVIDGQQRLITLSLLVLASMKVIQDLINNTIDVEDNTIRLNELRQGYIGKLRPTTLTPYNKLTLNRNNNQKFKQISEMLSKLLNRNLTKTDKLLSDCFEFFHKKVSLYSGQEIIEFIEKITDSMLFTKIIVDNDLNAYKIFETLNARGVQLSTPDLLKNYLFSQVVESNTTIDDGELEDLDAKWSVILSELGEENFTDFVRYYYNSEYRLTTKKKLFSTIRDTIKGVAKSRNYLNDLSTFAPIYAALNNPEDVLWTAQEYQPIKNYIKAFKLFNLKQPLLLLLQAYKKFEAKEFVQLAKYLYVFSIRYSVIAHNSPNKLENTYNDLAMAISSGKHTRASHIKNRTEFRLLYPSDEVFINIFKYHTMPSQQSNKKIRFILAQIDNYLSGSNNDYIVWTLEHIIPDKITDEWITCYGGNYRQDANRLGNMTLLTSADNKQCARQLFAYKKSIYKQSNSKLSNKIASYDDWNAETLMNYQTWLAEKAANTWIINYN